MDDRIAQLIQHFAAVQNADEQIREPSNAAIIQFIQTDPFTFIFCASQILKLDHLDMQIYQMSIICIGRALTPTVFVSVDLMAQQFLNPANEIQRRIIKEALFRCLMFDNQVIRGQASYCINILFQIEKDQWSDLLPALFELAASDKYPICAHSGAIQCFTQLLNPQIPIRLLSGVIPNFYELITSDLLIPDKIPNDFYEVCFKSYLSILNSLFETSNINDAMAQKCFHIINAKFKTEIEDTNFLLDALLVFFKGLYSTSILEHISTYLTITQEILHKGSYDDQLNAINFWIEAAKFESMVNQSERKNIIECIAASFFPFLAKIIIADFRNEDMFKEMLDTNSPTFEEPQAFRYGHKCLSKFYLAAPEMITELVLKFWKESFTSPENQIVALVALRSILTRKCRNNFLEDFLESDATRQTILSLLRSDNPILGLFAMMLIQKAIREFSSFIRNDEQITTLISLLNQTSENNISLIPYACHILNQIAYKYDDTTILSPTLFDVQHFEEYWTTINHFLSKAQTLRIFIYSFNTLSLFVRFVPSQQIGVLGPIIERFKSTIAETLSPQCTYPPDAIPHIQQTMIYLLAPILQRLAMEHVELPDIDEIIKLLFALSQKQEIYEEVLYDFSAIIRILKNNFAPYLPMIMEVLLAMIKTQNSLIIRKACLVLSDLFLNLGSLMNEYADPVFKYLVQIISNNPNDRELILTVGTTLADIIQKAPLPLEHKQQFSTILQQLGNLLSIKIKFDVPKEERQIILRYFHLLFYGYREIIMSSLPDPMSDIRSINYKSLFAPMLMSFISLDVSFYDNDTFQAFLYFLMSLADLYANQPVVIISLNNQRFRNYLKHAEQYPGFKPYIYSLIKSAKFKLQNSH